MSENTMREAFEAEYHLITGMPKNKIKEAFDDVNCVTVAGRNLHVAFLIWQAAIAHQNQEALKFNGLTAYYGLKEGCLPRLGFVAENDRKEYESIGWKFYDVFLSPPQPQEVADALEAAAKICDKWNRNSPAFIACEIRALIK